MPKTIGIVSALYLPHLGGVERFTQGLAFELANMGHDVSIITCNHAGLAPHESPKAGVEVYRLPCLSLMGGRFPLIKANGDLRRINAALCEKQFEGILINTRFYPASLYGLKLGRRAGVRPVVLDHGSSYIGFDSPKIDWLVHGYEHTMTGLIKRYKPDFYGVSCMSARWLDTFGIAAKGVIHNAINAEAYRSSASDRNFREELGISSDELMVVFTGRLLVSKGVRSVARVAQILHERGVKASFVLAGDGPELPFVKNNTSPNVYALGRLDSTDVAALLLQSNLFLFPSEYPEGLPTSVLEAGACGLTTIGTNVGGMREIMPTEDYGIVYEAFDAERCAVQIEAYNANRQLLAERGALCRRRVEEEFSWRTTACSALDAMERANVRSEWR